MNSERPDPDRLLAQLKEDEAEARRGKLKIFFGASAGVGKTYAMLQAAHGVKQQGVDVLIGVVETHGRAETEALVGGLNRLPLKPVPYRERTLLEFDLDGALLRKPALVLLDELAHSNVPGSRHPKRWQDVEELLDAGIDVWTTMNVQHLDSLNDVVGGITGIRVLETVPDHVFDEADEVVIVDLPPDELLQRLKDGKVYLAQQAERAVRNFFRKGNLIALRELALRRTADRVDREVLQYRKGLTAAPVWQTRESLLLCIGPDERSDKLVRATARMAAQLDVPWHCVYVETPQLERLPDPQRQRILRVLKLAQDAGASTAVLSGSGLATTLARYAHEHNLSRVVLGRDVDRRAPLWRRTLAEAIGEAGPDLDVIQVALPSREGREPPTGEATHDEAGTDWRGYGFSAGICAAVTVLTAPLHAVLDLANIVMVFLLAVVFIAVRFGRGPAVLAAFLSVGAFDFFYVPPRFTFSVSDAQYLLTFAVMLVVALVIGQLTAGLKFQARVATSRETRVRALYQLARELSAAMMTEQVLEVAQRFMRSEMRADASLLSCNEQDQLMLPADAPADVDISIARWAFDHNEMAGQGTNTLPAAPRLYLPLKAPMRMRGVLAIRPDHAARLAGPEQRQLLDTCASLLAISLERIHYVDVAQTTTVQMESERLRNSLLSAISHDLRTPLATLVGLADTLRLTQPEPSAQQIEIAHAMRDSALRMNALVSNLLDMARLEAGAVQLNRQWQPLDDVLVASLAACETVLAGRPVDMRLPDALPLLHIDAVLMERVLVNLFENIAKYTPPETPVSVRVRSLSNQVELVVEDRGPGLPVGREEAIFQKFERGRKESATPGVGLGLAICRAIVEAHGGRIHAENVPEGGARFIVLLPRGEPPTDSGNELLAVTPNDNETPL
jgi:two-component system, OmpR family, sensor histidine kinase KdpD